MLIKKIINKRNQMKYEYRVSKKTFGFGKELMR